MRRRLLHDEQGAVVEVVQLDQLSDEGIDSKVDRLIRAIAREYPGDGRLDFNATRCATEH